jgi:hypothetical protein
MVWATIGVGYCSKLIMIRTNVDRPVDRKIIDESDFMRTLSASRPFVFQQDGAPAHLAHETMSYLKKQCTFISHWPANSPDVSPIKNLRSLLKRTLKALRPQNLEELEIEVLRL